MGLLSQGDCHCHSFCTDWQSARPAGLDLDRPVRPAENPSIFATSLHCFTLVSFGHTARTDPSPRNAQKIRQGRMLLRILTVYSWPKAIRYNIHPFSRRLGRGHLATMRSFRAPSSKRVFAQHRSLLLNMPPFRTREHFTEQGLLIRTKHSSNALSVFPDACPHDSTGNCVFPRTRHWT